MQTRIPQLNLKRTSMLNVFLCHASQDKEKVRELYEKLIKDGLNPWLDEKSILPGQDWNLEIRNAIRNAHAVIVCLSNNSINKVGYIQKELKLALDIADEQPEGVVFLIPIRLEECTVPQRLSHLQYADLFRNEYEKLLQVLQIRASKLGIRITKRDLNSSNLRSLNKITDEEERSELIGEQFKNAFKKMFLNNARKLRLNSLNQLNLGFVGVPGVGKTSIIYTLADQDLNPLSRTSSTNTGERRTRNIKKKLSIIDLSILHEYESLIDVDFVFYVLSIDHPLTKLDRTSIDRFKQERIPYIVLINKTDMLQVFQLSNYSSTIEVETESICICYSVLSPINLELLRSFITKVMKKFTDKNS
jgi:GTP-binding protein EngB required for normal cell division